MKKKKVLLMLAAYNEEENIERVCEEIITYNQKNNTSYDFLVINDGSTDKTGQILDEKGYNHVDLIHNLGIGGAIQTGYKYAKEKNYDIAVQYDGDGQHDIHYVQKIIDPIIHNDADFVIGSRFVENISKFKTSRKRRIGIKIISIFIKMACGFKGYDTTSGFRACNKEIIKDFARDYPIEYPEPITIVEVAKRKYRIKEVGVNMRERIGGKSSIHSWKEAYYMLNVCLSILIAGIRRYK